MAFQYEQLYTKAKAIEKYFILVTKKLKRVPGKDGNAIWPNRLNTLFILKFKK
jgi:hypothetical protein